MLSGKVPVRVCVRVFVCVRMPVCVCVPEVKNNVHFYAFCHIQIHRRS